jgi:hypothetical protein
MTGPQRTRFDCGCLAKIFWSSPTSPSHRANHPKEFHIENHYYLPQHPTLDIALPTSDNFKFKCSSQRRNIERDRKFCHIRMGKYSLSDSRVSVSDRRPQEFLRFNNEVG